MPLYDIICIIKIGEAQALGSYIKGVVNFTYTGTGVIRNIRNLGDRISARSYKKNNSTNDFVRYISFQIDQDPISYDKLLKSLQNNPHTLHVYSMKLNQLDYYKSILNKEYLKKFEGFEMKENEKKNVMESYNANIIAKKLRGSNMSNLNFDIKYFKNIKNII